jgi:hypothetical protein
MPPAEGRSRTIGPPAPRRSAPPEARIDGEPLAERFRQIAPRRAGARNPKNGFVKSRLSRLLLPGSPALPDSSGAIHSHWLSLKIKRIKADFLFQPLINFLPSLGILSVNRPSSTRLALPAVQPRPVAV